MFILNLVFEDYLSIFFQFSDYSETKIHRMLNAELADTLGNLLNRCCAKAVNQEQIFPIFYHESFKSLSNSNIQHLIDTTCELPGNPCFFQELCVANMFA